MALPPGVKRPGPVVANPLKHRRIPSEVAGGEYGKSKIKARASERGCEKDSEGGEGREVEQIKETE